MKSKINFKSLIAGIIIGICVTGTVSVFGNVGFTVQAWIQDNHVKIYIDGTQYILPEDSHILNYNGRVYTPVRSVTEAIGGKVEWEEARQAIIINSPEPEIIEVEVEVEVEKDSSKDSSNNKYSSNNDKYMEMPVRITRNDIRIELNEHVQMGKNKHIFFDLKNDSGHYMFLKYTQAYMEIEGVRYEIDDSYRRKWEQSITDGEELKEQSLVFMDVPKEASEAKIVIPVEAYRGQYYDDFESIEYVFYVDISY